MNDITICGIRKSRRELGHDSREVWREQSSDWVVSQQRWYFLRIFSRNQFSTVDNHRSTQSCFFLEVICQIMWWLNCFLSVVATNPLLSSVMSFCMFTEISFCCSVIKQGTNFAATRFILNYSDKMSLHGLIEVTISSVSFPIVRWWLTRWISEPECHQVRSTAFVVRGQTRV